jgi:CHAT domain-containing protein/Tfp pilus assembly protein PilF
MMETSRHRLIMGLDGACRVGLALLVNLTIVSGTILPGVAESVAPTPAQTQPADELQRSLDEGSRLLKAGSKAALTAAIAQFERALKLSQTNDQRLQRALALVSLGRIYADRGQPAKTEDYYNQAILLLRAEGRRSGEANLLNAIATIYETQEPPKALNYFNQALPIWRDLGDRSRIAATLNAIGSIYTDFGEKPKALDYYNQALPVWRALGDRAGEAKTLSNIGLVYSDLGEKAKALDYYRQALPIQRAVGARAGEATTLINIGAVYADLGEQSKAIDYFNQALPMTRAVGARSKEAITLNNLGRVYSALGESSKALDYYNQALPISQALGNRSDAGVTLNNIGSIYDNRGETTKALDYYQQALLIWQAVGDRSDQAVTLNNIAGAYKHLGQKSKALDYYNQALPLQRAVGNRSTEATTLNNLGTLYIDLDQPAKARDYYRQALQLHRAVGDRSGEAVTLANQADCGRRQNQLTDALQNINAAIDILESLRSELKNDALKTSYFASVQSYYQLKIQILMQLHQQQPTQGYDAQALETADQSRARVLRELLIQANANISKDVSPDLLKQEQTLNQAIDAKEKQLTQGSNGTATPQQLTTLSQEITALYTQRDDLKNTIRAASPAYANLQYPKPTTLAQIQQQLDPNTLMLQYSLGDQESYLWVIGSTSLKTYILPPRRDIAKTTTTFRTDLYDQVIPLNSATQLTQQILAPAAAILGQKHLVIIPDGILHTIPFAALNTPNSKTYSPLITQHEITNLPSASTIDILRRTVATKPRGSKKLAILADPIFRKDDNRLAGKTIQANQSLDIGEQMARRRTGRDLDLNRLPFTATEAQGILALVPQESDRTTAFGFDASYDWITDPKISQYRYVHLATHGFFDNDTPALSSIILSSFDAQGRDRKAYLRFPDLFNLNLPTELVVLSACETGLGSDVPGEGLVGMTRGLMYAGALRVAVSLWSVDDKATSDLMQDFYKNLWQSQKSHAAALREAQLKLWKQNKSPYYWAAFTLQGEWRK